MDNATFRVQIGQILLAKIEAAEARSDEAEVFRLLTLKDGLNRLCLGNGAQAAAEPVAKRLDPEPPARGEGTVSLAVVIKRGFTRQPGAVQ